MQFSTRLIASTVSLIVLTTGIVASLAYHNITSDSVPRALKSLEADATHLSDALDNAVRAARADVVIYARANATALLLNAGADSSDRAIARESRDRLERWFSTELVQKPHYQQIRVIGASDGGREMVRVDRSGPGDQPRVFGQNEMARRGDRDYFIRGLATPGTGVYLSPIELYREDGKIVSPIMPLIRIVTPLHRIDGRAVGIVVVNLDMRPLFERIRAVTERGSAQYLVNAEGDYLVHPDASREFGFDLGRRHRIQDDFPALKLPADDGAVSQLIADRDGRQFGAAMIALRPGGDGERITVIRTQTYDEMVAAIRPLRESVLAAALFATLTGIALAIALARSLARPLGQITAAVDAFAHGKPLSLPAGFSGEIGRLAKSFRRMAEQVTERTTALRRHVVLLDKTMASIADAVLVIDRDGRIVFTNPACRALFGNRDDVGSEAWRRVYHRFRMDGVTPLPPEESPIGRAQLGESFDALELIMRREGETKDNYIVASGRPIRDAEGRFDGGVIVYRDLTEARETERLLRQAQKLESIGQLTGGVAHDFNNILTVIVGTIGVLEGRAEGDPELQKALQMMDRAAMRGADLTRNLLAVARQQALRPRKTDINALVKDAATLLRATLGTDIEIKLIASTQEIPPVVIDPSQLTAALLNLAVNARDAMPEGGKLMIETDGVALDDAYAQANPGASPGRYVLVAVSDTGTGIPPAVLERVFEPFFTTKAEGKGTGLGLSMVYGFIKQSRGHIKIYSEVGLGTTIRMYLPLGASEGEAEEDTSAPAATTRGETILAVEDDEQVRATALEHLKSLGYGVISAASGPEALKLVEEGAAFDLLFTDVVMAGGMNGRVLADRVRELRPGTPVLFTSGYTENALVHHGRLDPGVHLLDKPYRKAELAQKLRHLLDKA